MFLRKKSRPRNRAEILVSAREQVVTFLRRNSVILPDDELLLSRSGDTLKWLLDTRVALLHPEISVAIATLYWDYLERVYPFQICCLELTGIPLMMGVQAFAQNRGFPINAVVIRKERKATGRQRQIEGTLNDLPIVFVDDILHSGDSIERARVALALVDRKISHVVALVDFDSPDIGTRLLFQGSHLKTLIKLDELGLSKSPKPSQQHRLNQIFREVWRFSPEVQRSIDVVPKSTPVFDKQRIYYGTDSGSFSALNRLTGMHDWTFKSGKAGLKGIRSSPLIEGETVYFGAYDGIFYALEGATGNLLWQFSEADWIGSSPCCAPELNSIFVGLEHALRSRRGSLIALDMQSGERKWEFWVDDYIHGSPIFIKEFNVVVVGSNSGKLICVDATTGELRWHYEAKGAIKSRPSYDPQRRLVFAGSFDKAIYAWNIRNGDLVWKVFTDGAIYSEPLILSDNVYVCSTDKHFYSLRTLDGEITHKYCAGAKLFCSPSSQSNRVYFGCTSGRIFEYDPVTQEVVGTHIIPERITNTIVCDSEFCRYYVTTVDGNVIAFEHIDTATVRI